MDSSSPPTNLAAKSKEFGCLHRDRVRTKAWFCGSLLWALSNGQTRVLVSHSVVVRGSLSRAQGGGSLFKLGTLRGVVSSSPTNQE